MKFCSDCGQLLVREIPLGDDRLRDICQHCNTVHYENPRVVAGCILHHKGRILLCRRDIEPRKGYWSIPAGYLENGESTLEGAAREAREEAFAEAVALRLFGVFTLPKLNQLYIVYSGELHNGYCKAGDETMEVGLFGAEETPIDEMAFQLVAKFIADYWADTAASRNRVYHADVVSDPGKDIELIEHPFAEFDGDS